MRKRNLNRKNKHIQNKKGKAYRKQVNSTKNKTTKEPVKHRGPHKLMAIIFRCLATVLIKESLSKILELLAN